MILNADSIEKYLRNLPIDYEGIFEKKKNWSQISYPIRVPNLPALWAGSDFAV